jgi:hypothetical protein
VVEIDFGQFKQAVNDMGCVYSTVDRRYYHVNVPGGEQYQEINLQPGYQKLCYENALDYVRYRHTDSDFVRVARQQDFLRDLREQINLSDKLGQIDTVAKAAGHAIVQAGFSASAGQLIELTKLIAFSQSKPLRQVRFQTTNVDARLRGGSYVTSTQALEAATLNTFLYGHEALSLPAPKRSASSSSSHGRHPSHRAAASSPAALGLTATGSSGQAEAVKAALGVPFPVLYPTLQTAQGEQQTVRPYALRDQQGNLHRAYVAVWRQNTLGGYYDFEGTDWLNPPLFAHATTRVIGGRSYRFVNDGAHIHVVGWRSGQVLYWLTNTLLEDLSNTQMLAIARSAQTLH